MFHPMPTEASFAEPVVRRRVGGIWLVVTALLAAAAVLVIANIAFVDRTDNRIPDQNPSELIPVP